MAQGAIVLTSVMAISVDCVFDGMATPTFPEGNTLSRFSLRHYNEFLPENSFDSRTATIDGAYTVRRHELACREAAQKMLPAYAGLFFMLRGERQNVQAATGKV